MATGVAFSRCISTSYDMKILSDSPTKFFSLLLAATGVGTSHLLAADTITVQMDKPGVTMSPMFYGLMTEEINHSYDGGLYGELVRNRVFKDNERNAVNWSAVEAPGAGARIALDNTSPLNTNLQTSLRIEVTAATEQARAGVANTGYWGIPVKANTVYHASFYAKGDANFQGAVTITIESNDGATVYAEAKIPRLSGEWKQYAATLKTGQVTPTTEARLVISAHQPGTIWLNLVSLFPPTYHDRTNGNRIDLMELMGGMKPSFLRLPGGNYLEGDTVPTRFDWQKTLGDLAERPGHQGTWNYRSSDGIGLLELLEWCEDLKMQPLLAVWAGYALRGEHIATGADMVPYVQEALDEIEYVTGDASTKWGAVRAKDGHPAPFPLTYVEIGNEDFADRSRSYNARYAQFYDAIKAKYPNLQLIATTRVTGHKMDVLDDHYYLSARQIEADAHHYDKISRNGPKIFVGEWATREGDPTPTMNAALGDAAWLIGLERNSDLVVMESYAPLLVNVNRGGMQWATDLIGYDALHSYGSPSYYVQKMFAENHGQTVFPVEINAEADKTVVEYVPKGAIGVGTWSTQAEYKDIKVTHDGAMLFQGDFSKGTQGWHLRGGQWSAQEGALVQSSGDTDVRATAGDPTWTDYTYELKARKTGGAEGFLILFHVANDNRYVWWNLGGWNNSRTTQERAENGAKSEFGEGTTNTIETGRWYDIKVEVKGREFRGYLDGKLVGHATDSPAPNVDPIYANATRNPNGDLYLHVANVTGEARQVAVYVQGATTVMGPMSSWVLAGRPDDVNTLEQPEKIAPKVMPMEPIVGATFTHEFPAHSVSVLKLRAQ
jgi:alpha-L-arabinofuranosidase